MWQKVWRTRERVGVWGCEGCHKLKYFHSEKLKYFYNEKSKYFYIMQMRLMSISGPGQWKVYLCCLPSLWLTAGKVKISITAPTVLISGPHSLLYSVPTFPTVLSAGHLRVFNLCWPENINPGQGKMFTVSWIHSRLIPSLYTLIYSPVVTCRYT